MSWRIAAEYAGFQAVWMTCALGAAHGSSIPGVVAALCFLAARMIAGPCSRAVVGTLLASGALGGLFESALAGSGLVSYAASWPGGEWAPAWILALWLAFGATVPTTATLLGKAPIRKAAIAGAVFGPLAYFAGERLGALEIGDGAEAAYLAIMVGWLISMPLLVGFYLRLARNRAR